MYIMEYIPEVNYNHLMSLVNTLLQQKPSVPVFSKDELKGLLKIAWSDREKECIRYATWRASGLSASAARKRFGFDNLPERTDRVQQAMEEARSICETVASMTRTQEETAF